MRSVNTNYPQTDVARQYGLQARARRPHAGGRNLRLIVKPALSRKENPRPITATFSTHIRTWLLIAALSGLLIAVGAAIGGPVRLRVLASG